MNCRSTRRVMKITRKRRQIKIHSPFGYAAEEGGRTIAVKVRCEDSRFTRDELDKMAEDAAKIYGYKEAADRLQKGWIKSGFVISKIHAMFFADETQNRVLLNDEVRFVGNVTFTGGKIPNKGDGVSETEIERVLDFIPADNTDPDAAHIMMLWLRGRWVMACNLVYGRKRVRARFELARQFHKVATSCFHDRLSGPLVDNLFSSTELAIQSRLLLHHYGRFSTRQDHDTTRRIFRKYATAGNIDVKFADHYDHLNDLRTKARYLNGLEGKSFAIDDSEGEALLATTKELLDLIEGLLAKVDLTRKPKAGHYLGFGMANITLPSATAKKG